MAYQQYGVIALLLALVAALIFSKRSPALWFGGALLLSYLVGWLPLEKALQNFANPSLVTLLLLLLVSIAIEKSQLVSWLSRGFAGKRLGSVIARLSLSTAFMSAFINNTAVVSTLMSSLRHHNHFAPSKLLLPLSYSAILGGMLTLIGTSTNLIVNGFVEQTGEPVLGFFDFTLLGALVLTAGIIVLVIGSRWLPDNREQDTDATPYYLTAHVRDDSQLIGKSVEQNQLRELQALFLAEIQRGPERICPVTPETVIEAGDELRFVGDIAAVSRLQQFPGLELLRQDQQQGELLEAVISYSSRLVGKSLKQLRFRHEYDAVVIAVRRGHERLQGGLGDLILHAGDVLILSVGKHFPGHGTVLEDTHVDNAEDPRPLDVLRQEDLLPFAAGIAAGLGIPSGLAPLEATPPEDFVRSLHVNLTAPWLLTQACLPWLRKAGDSAVVFVTDDPARVGKAYWGAYGLAKQGLVALVRQLSAETDATPVRVSALEPGPMRTDLRARAYADEAQLRVPAPAAYAPACVHLLSPAGAAKRGQVWAPRVPA